MNSVIEEALKLSREEKIALYYQLQEDLDFEDEALQEDDLTPEQWKELNKREEAIKNGTMKMITRDEFNEFLNKRRHGLPND